MDGLALNPVLTILLNDRCPITGLVLLDYGRVVAISVPVLTDIARSYNVSHSTISRLS